jgi:ABC-type glycerol-3-phosphate transport system permease component
MAYTVIPAVWQLSGFAMALYLGGIRSISEEIREAARVDGASELEIYRYVILPMLRPVTLSAVIILGHMSLKIFDLIVALGRKDQRLDVPGIYMWTQRSMVELRPGCGHRYTHVDQCSHPCRSLSDYQHESGGRAMTRRMAIRSLFYVALLSLAIFYLLPVYLMVLTGLKPFNEVDLKTMWDLPTSVYGSRILLRVFDNLHRT